MLLPFFVVAAVLIESLTGIVKTTLSGLGLKLPQWADQTISLVLALAFAIMGKINLFAVVSEVVGMDFNFPAGFGIFLSALVLSRGSNAVHDLFKTLNPGANEMRIW